MNNQSTINFNINENFKFNITLSDALNYYYILLLYIYYKNYFNYVF